MKILLQVGRPRQEKRPTTRHAANDLAHCFRSWWQMKVLLQAGHPQQEESQTTGHAANDLAHLFEVDSK